MIFLDLYNVILEDYGPVVLVHVMSLRLAFLLLRRAVLLYLWLEYYKSEVVLCFAHWHAISVCSVTDDSL